MKDMVDLAKEFSTECQEDYVGLWSVIRKVRGTGFDDETQVIEKTLNLLFPLLSQGVVSAGQFKNKKFQLWRDSPSEIIARIKREWIALCREPDIGDIVWFIASTGE